MGSRMADQKDPDLLAYCCRIAAELGADAIKTNTGDPETMAEVIQGCPVPVLTLAARRATPVAVVKPLGRDRSGASGIIFGRNVCRRRTRQRCRHLAGDVHGVPAGR